MAVDQQPYELGVERALPRFRRENVERTLSGYGGFVRTIPFGERVEHVRDRDHPRLERDLITPQAPGIAASVQPLMMAVGVVCYVLEVSRPRNLRHEAVRLVDVCLHARALLLIERSVTDLEIVQLLLGEIRRHRAVGSLIHSRRDVEKLGVRNRVEGRGLIRLRYQPAEPLELRDAFDEIAPGGIRTDEIGAGGSPAGRAVATILELHGAPDEIEPCVDALPKGRRKLLGFDEKMLMNADLPEVVHQRGEA